MTNRLVLHDFIFTFAFDLWGALLAAACVGIICVILMARRIRKTKSN